MAPIATLTVRLSAQIAEFQSEFKQATKVTQQFQQEFEGIATRAAAVGSFIGNIAAKIATSLASAFGQVVRDAIRVSSEFSNAFIGLGTVARAFGEDADAAKNAARRLSSDGLLPLRDSATGLKNLLATGFNLDQSVTLMNAFKDAAAFGRAGALSFGDAIRTATEGVKNGNSILVDNAGITKNLSQILKEAGFSAQDLSKASSDAAVRLALFNGILKEAAAFSGDAARLTETYSGQVDRLNAAYEGVLVTIGGAITQNATVARTIGAISDAVFGLNQNLVSNRNAFNLVSDGVIFAVRAFAGLINVFDLVQTGFRGLQQVSNRFFEAFSNIAIAAFKLIEKTAQLQGLIDPTGASQAIAKQARANVTFFESVSHNLREASKDAEKASIVFGNALQEINAAAKKLAKELEETRGKTIAFGVSGRTGGREFGDGVKDGLLTAEAALKSFNAAMAAKGSFKIGPPSTLPGVTIDLGKMFNFIAPDLPSIIFGSLKQGLTNLPGVKLPIPVPPPLPRDFWNDYLTSGLDRALENVERRVGGMTGDLINLGRTGLNAFAQMSEAVKTFGKNVLASTASVLQMGTSIIGLVQQAVAFLERDNLTGRMVRDFELAQGGARQLAADAALAGVSLAALYNTDSASAFRREAERVTRAIADQRRMLDAYNLSWRDFNSTVAQTQVDQIARTLINDFKALTASGANPTRVIEGMSGAINQLIIDAVRTGTRIPAAMRPMIEAMIRAGQVTEEAARAMLGLAEDTMPSLADITAAAERYGLTLDQLGPKVQQLRINEEARQIVKDFKLLELAGADVVVVAVAMKDKIQDMVTTALKSGLTIPEGLRPIIKILIDMGLLVDENGNKLENMDRINFGRDLTQAIDDLIDKLEELIDAFSTVGTTAEDAWRRAAPPGAVFTGGHAIPRPVPGVPAPPAPEPNPDEPAPPPGGTTPGARPGPQIDFSGNTGPQAVPPVSPTATITPSAATTTVIFEVDGQVLAETAVPYIPGAVRRYVTA